MTVVGKGLSQWLTFEWTPVMGGSRNPDTYIFGEGWSRQRKQQVHRPWQGGTKLGICQTEGQEGCRVVH